MKSKTILTYTITILSLVCLLSVQNFQEVKGCYGPHITAQISSNEIKINENVTINGEICPADPNVTIRVTFTRPDYTWIDQFVVTDSEGKFSVTQNLDEVGYWNIFPIYGHICDRLHANVTDPNADPNAPMPTFELPPYKPNYTLVIAAGISLSLGTIVAVIGTKNKTRKISSLRLLVQIGFVFLIFFGMFIDHQNIPVPAEQIAPHEVLISNEFLGVSMPDGLPVTGDKAGKTSTKKTKVTFRESSAYVTLLIVLFIILIGLVIFVAGAALIAADKRKKRIARRKRMQQRQSSEQIYQNY